MKTWAEMPEEKRYELGNATANLGQDRVGVENDIKLVLKLVGSYLEEYFWIWLGFILGVLILCIIGFLALVYIIVRISWFSLQVFIRLVLFFSKLFFIRIPFYIFNFISHKKDE